MKSIYPSTTMCDFYKLSHRAQYPQGTQKVYSTWTPRKSLIEGIDSVIAFGFQGFIKETLIEHFNTNFFNRPKEEVVKEYERLVKYTLGEQFTDSTHIAQLHDLGYLPIKIMALPEGTATPIRVPMLTIENTDERFPWLTNYLETIMSCSLWQMSTSATVAKQYRGILDKYAMETIGSTEGVDFQAHDFSMRGMGGIEAAAKSGAGHLLSFRGSDTIPAIHYLEAYYNADIERELVATSIPATEHSVMCSYGRENEFSTYKHLITEVYPKGFMSIVSDTWDLWYVVNNFLPKLKDDIVKRDGRVVIRPDSGNPVDIICGEPNANNTSAQKGLIESLWDIFGGTISSTGYKVLDSHIGALYGDAITLERAEEICSRLKSKGFASTNVVFGVGSFTYQYKTRDSFGFALKSTYVKVNGKEINIFKDPATDTGHFKKSQTGMVAVVNDLGILKVVDGLTEQQRDSMNNNEMQTIYKDGSLTIQTSLAEIREHVKEN